MPLDGHLQPLLSILTLVFLGDPTGRALRLNFIPEEFAFAGFACFQRQRLALWGDEV